MFFVFCTGGYQQEFIWVLASDLDLLDYVWHYRYSYRTTEVLGKLAYLIISKILGRKLSQGLADYDVRVFDSESDNIVGKQVCSRRNPDMPLPKVVFISLQ